MESSSKKSSYYYETSDLVIIALFAALGGISSSVIANIANLFNIIISGGGQIFAGLHVFWFVLVFLFTNRKIGVVILTGIIKGFIELFMGNPLGIIVVIISIGEAIVFEFVYLFLTTILSSRKFDHIRIVVAAGFATAINVIILLNLLLGQGLPIDLILLMLFFSFISGIGFGGYLGLVLYQLFERSGLLRWRKENKRNKDSITKQESSE